MARLSVQEVPLTACMRGINLMPLGCMKKEEGNNSVMEKSHCEYGFGKKESSQVDQCNH